MNDPKIPSKAEQSLRDLVAEIHEAPQRYVCIMTRWLLAAEALLFAQVLRLSTIPFILFAVLAVMGVVAIERWLDEVTVLYKTVNPERQHLYLQPVVIGLGISMIERTLGRLPILSFLVSIGILITAWTGASIYCALYFGKRFAGDFSDQNLEVLNNHKLD